MGNELLLGMRHGSSCKRVKVPRMRFKLYTKHRPRRLHHLCKETAPSCPKSQLPFDNRLAVLKDRGTTTHRGGCPRKTRAGADPSHRNFCPTAPDAAFASSSGTDAGQARWGEQEGRSPSHRIPPGRQAASSRRPSSPR